MARKQKNEERSSRRTGPLTCSTGLRRMAHGHMPAPLSCMLPASPTCPLPATRACPASGCFLPLPAAR